jgi:hypothetical protein
MARQNVDIGVQGNDGTGDSIRESFRKVNDNFIQLFSIFGAGDTISFKDLDDTPSTYGADQVIVSNTDGDGLLAKDLVGGEGIAVDHSDENEIRIISTGGKVGNDIKPQLGGHLNAQLFSIGNLAEPTDETADSFNSLHDTSITSDELVITKGFADQRYLQATGGPGTGSQIRVRDEPLTVDEYTIEIDAWNSGYAQIPDHGFNSGSNGISFIYNITGTAPATGLTAGTTYYLRYLDKNRLSVHETPEDAISGDARIVVNDPAVSPSTAPGVETFVDASFDPTLAGKWVSNEALPRKAIVRRQGDTMDGPLYLSDHPGEFAGAGSPNGPDDLQAATKFYVDSSSFASQTNLFVATSGTDEQDDVPEEKRGRAFAYAYASVNAACVRAEEIINNSQREPGPYRQVLTYDGGTNNCYLNTVDVGVGSNRTLNVYSTVLGVDQTKDAANKDLREGSIIRGLRSGATGLVLAYDGIVTPDSVYQIALLHNRTDPVYFQSDYFYASNRLELNKDFIVFEVTEFIKAKYPSLEFDQVKSRRDTGILVDALVHDIKYGGNIKSIKAARAFWNGLSSVLSSTEKAPCIDGINYINLLAQSIIDNSLIPTVTLPDTFLVRRRSAQVQNVSGTVGEAGSDSLIAQLVASISEIVEYGIDGNSTLLEFIEGETLEFGQPVPETQITVRIETGVYYEQYPIKVSTNVSIKGDEFRRVIIRPAPGISTSKWAGTYFYRDDEFDGLVRSYDLTGGSSVGTTITVDDTTGLESDMQVFVTGGTGEFPANTKIIAVTGSTNFTVAHAPTVALSGATVRALNNSGLAPLGDNFGYHYLTNPTDSTSPPKDNKYMDVFLMNDGTILRNITGQGHGGFMCVLDPEGQIQTKSPYMQTCTSLSGSINKQRFAGGQYIDGFAGNIPATIVGKNSTLELELSGLTVRQPLIPTSFVINGIRYQVNEVNNYNKPAGTATITLDAATPYLPSWSAPIDIIIQTPGNRSMLSNDFTQVNDLGYGIAATNNAVTELVSMFTYYNWTSYFANKGGQVRSTSGSSCNGIYGLRAVGFDPNEVPDNVTLGDDIVQVMKIYKRDTLSARNVTGDISIYVDHYKFIPYNVSELEIDYTPNKVSIIPDNTTSGLTNVSVVNPGINYAVGDEFTAVGGILYDGSSTVTTLRVTAITGGGGAGPISTVAVIDVGSYRGGNSPVGAGLSGTFTTNTSTGIGSGAIIGATYLGQIITYTVNTVEKLVDVTNGVGLVPGGGSVSVNVLKLNMATSQTGNSGEGVSLLASLTDGQTVIVRSRRQFRFEGVFDTSPARPSTSVTFTGAAEDYTGYNSITYATTGPNGTLPANEAIIEFNTGFETVLVQTDPPKMSGGYGSAPGDTKIALLAAPPVSITRFNSGNMIFGWAGRMHRVSGYVAASGPIPAHITFTDIAYGSGSLVSPGTGLVAAIPTARSTVLRAGLPENSPAAITVNISTCRATGHDFLDIGTGGYNTTNYPNNVFGGPTLPVAGIAQEVVESNGGRVYYMSTDQNGVFRVGQYFSVDQGTGTVSFSASIALSDLDGLGFKRGGSVVKEFSTDTTMADNDPYSATTEYAVREYVGKRLGIDHDGNFVADASRIPAFSGFLPVNTVGASNPTMAATLNMDGNFIISVHDPVDSGDAVNKSYVDTEIAAVDSFYKLKEVNIMTPAAGDIATFTGSGKTVISSTLGGDVTGTFTSQAVTTLVGGRTNPSVTDSGIIGTSGTSVANGIELTDASLFPDPGGSGIAYIKIDDEILSYTDKNGNLLENIVRAKFTTAGAIHTAGAGVISLDSSYINVQINADTIVDADINSAAAILQSKLAMNIAGTSATAPTGTAAVIQAANGLASFDSANFEMTNGWVGIKNGGVAYAELANIANGKILGNFTGSATYPREVSTTDIVQNGIDALFTTIDAGANVMTRRYNSLVLGAGGTTFSINPGSVAVSGSGLLTDIPITSVSGNGNGAKASIGYAGGAYTGIVVTYGGNGYAEGDQLIVKGSLLGGVDTTNDLTFTIETTVGNINIDSTVYLGIERVSETADSNSIVKTDGLSNLGNPANKYNNVYATTFIGNLTGTVTGSATSATTATNLFGSTIGSIPYQSAADTTTLLTPGASGRYLKSQGAGLPPVWNDIIIPDGAANTLTGTTLATNVVTSSLTSVGTLTGLSVNGQVTINGLVAVSVDNTVAAAGTDQATATIVDANINIVISATASSGVRLPDAVAGYKIVIRNNTATTILVYPGVDAVLADGGQNEPGEPLPIGAALEYFCTESAVSGIGGQWYTLNATYG